MQIEWKIALFLFVRLPFNTCAWGITTQFCMKAVYLPPPYHLHLHLSWIDNTHASSQNAVSISRSSLTSFDFHFLFLCEIFAGRCKIGCVRKAEWWRKFPPGPLRSNDMATHGESKMADINGESSVKKFIFGTWLTGFETCVVSILIEKCFFYFRWKL